MVVFEAPAMSSELLVSIHPTGTQQRSMLLYFLRFNVNACVVNLFDNHDSVVIQTITDICLLSLY